MKDKREIAFDCSKTEIMKDIPKVYFVKDKREIAFDCSETEIMKDVVRRFCTQYNFRKKG